MSPSRRHLVVVATAIGVLMLTAAAVAATGSLKYGGCMANDGRYDCRTPRHNSFGNNDGLAVSPDGRTVYVASVEGALTELRWRAGGGLAFVSCLADAGHRDCRDIPHDSLQGSAGVAVSPDSRSVYVTSGQPTNALTRFKQDSDGRLVYRGCFANGGAQAGLTGCRQTPRDSLDSNEAAVVSPDGRSVYVASSDSDSITFFQRKSNGALAYRGCIANRGKHGCGKPRRDSLGGAFDVAVSPDGESVYAVSLDGNAITWFDRTSNGSLAYRNCFANGRAHGCRALNHDSLRGADAVAVSPDGESVYVAALGGDSVTHFERAASGRLTPRECFASSGRHDCRTPKTNSLHAADGIAVSPDGRSVYASSMTGPTINGGPGAVTRFDRGAKGSLEYRGCFADRAKYGCHSPRLDSLGSPQSIAIDPGGTALFVGSYAGSVSYLIRDAGGP
jgi:DNA-binding beta-propeller fold protein YncE